MQRSKTHRNNALTSTAGITLLEAAIAQNLDRQRVSSCIPECNDQPASAFGERPHNKGV